MTQDPVGPLVAAGAAASVLCGQIARFGELAGCDLSAGAWFSCSWPGIDAATMATAA